jgi:acetolactate synthase I/II/III large subunit
VDPLLKSPMNTTDAIVTVLADAGIDMVFGLSGGHSGRILAALARHKDKIRTVLCRHEATAVAAAQAQGAATGVPGVAIGQGSWLLGHGVVGLLEGLLTGTPLILLGDLSDGGALSLHSPYQSGTGEYGSWNAPQAFDAMTKALFVARDPVQAVQCTQLAIKHAQSGQPGPVAVLFHSYALKGEVGPTSKPRLYSTRGYLATAGVEIPDISVVTKAISSSQRPVLIAGGGVRTDAARSSLMTVAMLSATPVATTMGGKGSFPEDHPLSAGVFGTYGSPLANEVVSRADTVIVIGSKLSPTDTAAEALELLDPARQRFLQIDVERRNAAWTYPMDSVVIADAALTLSAVAAQLAAVPVPGTTHEARKGGLNQLRAEWDRKLLPQKFSGEPIHPQRLIAELREALPDDVIICTDAGENRLLMCRYFQTRMGGLYAQPNGAGGMSYAVPAAIGLKAKMPNRTVVAVCGDGGFSMSLAALLTALEERIPIGVVVFNNSALGWSKHSQLERGELPFNTQLKDFDYASIARAMGCLAQRVTSPEELSHALPQLLIQAVPVVIDVSISTAETFVDLRSPYAPRPESPDQQSIPVRG